MSRPLVALALSALLPLVFVAAACARVPVIADAPAPTTLPSGVVAAISSTVARSTVVANQITMPWERSEESDALDAAREGIARRKVEPLQAETRDVNFQGQYAAALQPTLSEVGWLKLRRLDWTNDAPAAPDRQDARLLVKTSQTLSPRANLLLVESTLTFYRAGTADAAPSARLQLQYRSEEIGPARNADAIALWSKSHGFAYRTALADGIAESMKMTTMALERMAGTQYAGRVEELIVWLDGESRPGQDEFRPAVLVGTVVEETETRVIIQLPFGFYSIPKTAISARDLLRKTPGTPWQPAPAASQPRGLASGASKASRTVLKRDVSIAGLRQTSRTAF